MHLNRLLLVAAVAIAALTVAACSSAGSEPVQEYEYLGEPLSGATALSPDEAIALYSEDGESVVVEGIVREICQNAGCWLILETESRTVLRVHVPRKEDGEYAFVFPERVGGQQVVLEGRLSRKVLSAEEQEHYAGESVRELAAPEEFRIDLSGARLIRASS